MATTFISGRKAQRKLLEEIVIRKLLHRHRCHLRSDKSGRHNYCELLVVHVTVAHDPRFAPERSGRISVGPDVGVRQPTETTLINSQVL